MTEMIDKAAVLALLDAKIAEADKMAEEVVIEEKLFAWRARQATLHELRAEIEGLKDG